MATENPLPTYSPTDASSDNSKRIRDIEEKQRLLKERMLLIGQSLIDERDKSFKEIQELKKTLEIIKEETLRMKDFIQRITEQLDNTARKEELMILQRQFDLFRQR